MKSPIKYQYDVKIEFAEPNPENRPRRIPKSFYNMIVRTFMNNNFPGRIYAYDGDAILYTGHPLGNGLLEPMTAEVSIRDPDREVDRNFLVTIKFAAEIDFSLLHEAIVRQGSLEDSRIENARTCLQIIFRGNSARHNVIQSGKAFLNPVSEFQIGKGKVIKQGLSHTVILGTNKAFLNVDVIYKIFAKSGNIIDEIIQEVLADPPRRDQPPPRPVDLSGGLSRYQQQDLEEFINLIKGLKVEVKIPNGPVLLRSRVNGLKECPRRNYFEREGTRITVEQHFQDMHGYAIRYPNLPCLWIGPLNRNHCYPIELCSILPNQAKKLKNSDSDIRAIGSKATCDTRQRARNIMGAASAVSIRPQNEYLSDFGVQVAGEFTQVESKILIHPKLGYRSSVVEVNKGQWNPGVFRGSRPLNNWCIVVLDDRVNKEHVLDFKGKFIRYGQQMGMTIENINPDRHVEYQDSRISEDKLKELFKNLLKKFQVQLVLVVLPFRNTNDVYSRVKKASEIKSGVLTSCVKDINFKKAMDSTIKNILLKVNTKLNGVNHILLPVPSLQEKGQWCIGNRTMVLGADVTHNAPQDRQKIPSVAAVVASHDEHASLYNMEWSFQQEDRRNIDHEIIKNLKEMVTKQLKFYIQKLGYKPERLIFFRDGVSEGEFDKVRFIEIRAIKQACLDVCKENTPLTFVVVQKRHRTRFFPDPQDKRQDSLIHDKNRNVPAGTVVDTEIVRQDMFEFYMVSHASILGVARPAKYKTLLDESNITAEELQHLTYYLCHMFNRCTRSVSYPAPTYYAHLACKRIRSYLSTSASVDMSNLREAERRLKGDQQFYLNNPLYFI